MVTAIGVLNLIFSLVCGCVSLAWAAGWAMLHDNPDDVTTQITDGMRRSMEISIESRGGEKNSPAFKAIFEEAGKPDNVRELLMAARASPATPTIRTATMAAGLAQGALFVGSILLLMRKNTGRVLSMLALVVFIAATITTMLKFSGPAEQMGAELKTRVSASPGYQALPPPDREQADRFLTVSPEIFEGLVGGTSAFAMAWPAISLLILLASRGIKDACSPTYGRR